MKSILKKYRQNLCVLILAILFMNTALPGKSSAEILGSTVPSQTIQMPESAHWEKLNGHYSVDIADLTIDPANSEIIYAATESGVYKSYDSGETWTGTNTGLTDSCTNVSVIALQLLSWSSVGKISTHADNINNEDWDPQIAVDASGNSYVTWYGSDGNDQEIYWVKVDASGTPGTVQKISTHADNINNEDWDPQIAVDASGNSHVTWYGSDGSDLEIYWVKVDASGTPGTVQKISTHADNINNSDWDPQIAVDASGNSYVTWFGSDGNDQEIYWVKVDASGTPGTVQKISTHADNINNEDWDPQIAVDASGNSHVTWYGSDGSDLEIYWVKVDASGTPGTVQKISTHADNINSHDAGPQIAVDASGNSYVTWEGLDGTDWEIYWVKVDASGTPGTVQKISTHADNINNEDWRLQIAADASGNSYVTWEGLDGTDWEIYWVKVDASGTPGTVQKISTHADNVNNEDAWPQIAVDASGNSYVTWYGWDGTDWEIYWVKLDASGTPGTVQKISTHADNINNSDWDPQIAVDASGNSYVTWRGYDGSDDEIYFTSGIPDSIGPVISNTTAAPNPTNCASTVTVTATIDDSGTGNANIQQAEYFIDVIGPDGTGTPLSAQDGTFNSPTENVTATINVSGWAPGLYTIFVHGQDALGNWGGTQQITLNVIQDCTGPVTSNTTTAPNPTNCASTVTVTATIDDSGTGNANIQQAEYFIDVIGPDGTGTPLSAQDGTFNSPTENVTAVIDVTGLSPGLHTVYVHGQDALGNWGAFQSVSLTVTCQRAAETPPTKINEQIRPLAQYNISVAEDLSIEAQDLLSQAKAQALDTSECEELIRKAEEFLTKAQEHFKGGNYIAANIYALKAIEAYQEAIDLLTELLD